MTDRLPHLPITRVEQTNDRRRRRGFGARPPDDIPEHARHIDRAFAQHQAPPATEIEGFDPRRLLKLTLSGIKPDELNQLPGFSVVSQEEKSVTVLFADEGGLAECRRRLQRLGAGLTVTRKELLYAIHAVDEVTAGDRTGPALRTEGHPATERFILDIELWPLDRADERGAMLRHFKGQLESRGVRLLDEVNNFALTLIRVEASGPDVPWLLSMRDVRQVDLPPSYDLETGLLQIDVSAFPEITAPPQGAPGVVVLDSGIATNHPLLGSAVGDQQEYTGRSEATPEGLEHGTFVGSLALHGDLEQALQGGSLAPELRLFSGRIWDDGLDGGAEAMLLENRISRAVRYFREAYGCRLFVLAFGDKRKLYTGAHVDRLAATLDTLAREQDVLFVISTGNFEGTEEVPSNWRTEYPTYLTKPEARIIDPATALNALTVGGLARHEVSFQSRRYPDDPAHRPIARTDQPSPFTRSGPGPLGAVKPELVEYAGNWFVDTRAASEALGNRWQLGELGASSAFATGQLVALRSGTSLAAPKVANIAARLLAEYPDASTDLVRALLVAHAQVPEAAKACFSGDEKDALQVVGYGRPTGEASRYSSETCVTFVSEERIGTDQHHFYELPMPDDLFVSGRRERRITVALAHTPSVRRTRLEYKETALEFRVVRARSVDEVATAYRRLKQDEEEDPIPEAGFFPGPAKRTGGTVQCASRIHKVTASLREKPYFIVVTNKAPGWSTPTRDESYALVVVIEDRSGATARLYSQAREILRARARVRGRA
jgi:hypothetical protein